MAVAETSHDPRPAAIRIEHVGKYFKLPHEKQTSIKSLLVNFWRTRRGYEKQRVLQGVTFDIKQGEFFGIVGRNGSGKSTLLKLIAGIYTPSKGRLEVNGRLTPFIELGVGFNHELTGRENVFLNGALLGFSRKEMAAMYDDIVAFAELEKFMDQKLKNYSSGMQVRLAFSIAIRAESDILLIDEVLAVGDAIFQQKCFDYFKELKKKKKTVVLVSHDSSSLQKYCDRGALIEGGKVVSEGPITRVINDYNEILNAHEEKQEMAEEAADKQQRKNRWGNGDMQVAAAETRNGSGRAAHLFTDKDEAVEIVVTYRAKRAAAQPVYGLTIVDAGGQQIFVSNTMWSEIPTPDMRPGDSRVVTWRIPNIFNSGEFYISPAVADSDGYVMYDWRDSLTSFKVRKTLQSTALANVAHTITTAPGKQSEKS